MGDLVSTIQKLIENSMANASLTDLRVGTVETISPLSIQISDRSLPPIPVEALLLTKNVVEQHIEYNIDYQHTGDGSLSVNATFRAYEDGRPLPYTANSLLTLNESLKIGDRVLLLSVSSGQRFIVLSRLYGA